LSFMHFVSSCLLYILQQEFDKDDKTPSIWLKCANEHVLNIKFRVPVVKSKGAITFL
jgi:hypothetical protein